MVRPTGNPARRLSFVIPTACVPLSVACGISRELSAAYGFFSLCQLWPLVVAFALFGGIVRTKFSRSRFDHPEKRPKLVCRFALAPFHRMDVESHRRDWRSVPQEGLNGFDVLTAIQQVRRRGVPPSMAR